MDRLKLALHLLLLFSARTSFALGVSVSPPAEPRTGYPCPLDDDITPCTCTYDDDYALSMDCSEVMNDQELINAFDHTFPFPSFYSLTIDQTDAQFDENVLSDLTQYSFGAVSFEHVDIKGTTLTTVLEGAFRNSHETLISLHLQTNKISSFTFEIIGEFTKLTSLYLSGNNFDGVPIQPISSASLRTLNLDNNPMVNVDGNFVKDCPELRQLLLRGSGQTSVPLLEESPISMIDGLENIIKVDFSHNSISILEPNTFQTSSDTQDAQTINTLDLSYNDISIVFPNFVTGLFDGAETVLNLSNNMIELLDEAVWTDIFIGIGAGTVDLTENPLQCGCDMAWFVNSIYKDRLHEETTCFTGNLVSDLPDDAFANCF